MGHMVHMGHSPLDAINAQPDPCETKPAADETKAADRETPSPGRPPVQLLPDPEEPTETPRPCSKCDSPVYWRTIYDDALICRGCQPWPSQAVVKQMWMVVMLGDGFAWEESPLAWEEK